METTTAVARLVTTNKKPSLCYLHKKVEREALQDLVGLPSIKRAPQEGDNGRAAALELTNAPTNGGQKALGTRLNCTPECSKKIFPVNTSRYLKRL